MDELDSRQQALKQAFIDKRGYWAAWHEGLLRLNPNFLEAYLGMTSLPWTDGVLAPKVKEFIYIAIDAATTHLYQRGLRMHIASALQYGATAQEVMEVLELVSLLGWDSCTVAAPILAQELAAAGQSAPVSSMSVEKMSTLRKDFERDLGFWDDCCEALLTLSPQYLERFYTYAAVPWTSSTLEPKVKCFVALSVSASTTHLFEPGIRLHIRRALACGAKASELMEVLQLTSVLGIHTCSIGVPIFTEELARAGSP